MIKCIASDMDGTLLTATQKITDKNIEAIKAAQEKGVEVVIATGRSYFEASFVLEEAGISCPMICANGAEVRAADGKVVSSNPLDKTLAKKAAYILLQNNVYFEVYTNQGTYTVDEDRGVSIIVDIFLSGNPEADIDEVTKAAEERFKKGLVHKVNSYDELFNHEEHQIYKLLAFSFEPDFLAAAKEDLLQLDGLAVSSSGDENLELTSVNAQKGIALEAFVKEKGISLLETMAIGDNYNDLSMFKRAGRSVAMGNADEIIKAQCDAVTLTNEDSGVAKAIWEVLE
ncbi:HAD family hydrolase [Bacillus sp. ISL-47]|uniref:HAD family hydrolase n=1 Tax=Bacillus sp. ISL-47 TaxID=2819130 RepID=UPI001BE56C1E|nr:HAD family hydrolase [Bacillus sp. ISL-47]MBT2687333.1 HAD family hydrolase [Bacillus sp. ISL-47]MBT2706597.1 HAD family hydrolase [Pseudomonas sp. ISL-84]